MQSARWARAKAQSGRPVHPFWVSSVHGSGAVVVVIQPFSRDYVFGYVPWGPDVPVPPDAQGLFLEELAETLRPRLPEEVLFLRFDLPWRSPFDLEVQEDEGERHFEPVALPPAWVRSMRMNFGTHEHNLHKAPTDVQPTDTVLIDLDRAPTERLAAMKPKTRYNVRLAERRGVTVREDGPAGLEEWYEIYRTTMERAGTTVHDRGHFERLLSVPDDGEVGIHLLTARYEGRALAGLVLAVAGDYALYLYGASGDRERRRMPTYLLQWEAMRYARELGAHTYDLFGVPSDTSPGNPMHGLLRFKVGFGGHVVTRRGCWDYPFDPAEYEAVSGQELGAPGYHG